MPTLITPDELHTRLEDPASAATTRVLDVRWRKDRPEGLPEYLAGHIPGAVFVDLDYELAQPGLGPEQGRHPLPDEEDFAETVRRWGLDDGDTVVVYDDLKNLSSARAWWLLRHAGFADVRILDGSLRAWTGAGFTLADGIELPDPGDASVRFGTMPMLRLEEVESFTGTLIDARPAEDHRAAHIPGAISAPASGNLDDRGRFLPPERLRERYLELGVDPGRPVTAYCLSGLHSCHTFGALRLAGFDAVLFPGGFSQWAQHPGSPVVAGAAPGGT